MLPGRPPGATHSKYYRSSQEAEHAMSHPIYHDTIDVDGVRVFYRHTGPDDGLPVLLLHGFPTSSRQYTRLMNVLGDRYRLIAPDYPGFGHTQTPADFTYTFDRLADIVEGFTDAVGLGRFVLYAFDFGGPVGFRLMTRRPEALAGLIVQNANAYDDGISELAQGLLDPSEDLFELPTTRFQYETGVEDVRLIDPDSWTLDQHFLDLPGRRAAQLALARDYVSNIGHYAEWQAWLRDHRPPTLILWGRHDPIFLEPGANAYLRDLPDATIKLLNTGHFALEDSLDEAAAAVGEFLEGIE